MRFAKVANLAICSSVMTCAVANSSGTRRSSTSPPSLRTNSIALSLILRDLISNVSLSTTKLSGVTVPCTTYSPSPQEPSIMIVSSAPVTKSTVNMTPDTFESAIICTAADNATFS